MIKLKKLSSPTDLIKQDIEFKEGINIIKGAYENRKDRKNDRNGIGKSSVIRLIDFALMSTKAKNDYFNPEEYEIFEGHKVRLELEIEGEDYVIERSMNEPNKPEFGRKDEELNEYDNTQDLKIELGELMFPDFEGDYTNSFRDLSAFFLKDDEREKRRNTPYIFSKDKKKYQNYIYAIYLMGLPTEAIREFMELREEKKRLNNKKGDLENRLDDEKNMDMQEAKASLADIRSKINSIEEIIDRSVFLEGYEDIEDEIVELSKEISNELDEINKLNGKLNEIQESYDQKMEIDDKEVKEIYNEVNHRLGSLVKKSLDDIKEMRDSLSQNRRKFLKDKEEELENKIEKKQDRVSKLERERSKYYKMLNEDEALDSFENTYERLMGLKKKEDTLETHVTRIESVRNELAEIKGDINAVKMKMYYEIDAFTSERNKLQTDFSDLIQEVIPVKNAGKIVFDIEVSPEQQYPLTITVEVPKKNSDGKQQLKNVGFDITIFKNIIESDRVLPNYLVHDGAFKGIDLLNFNRILNYMQKLYNEETSLQYIVTANEEDLEIAEGEEQDLEREYDLDACTIITLKDQEESMLFGEEYDT